MTGMRIPTKLLDLYSRPFASDSSESFTIDIVSTCGRHPWVVAHIPDVRRLKYFSALRCMRQILAHD